MLAMSFNIRGSQHFDGENAWKRRASLNLRVIRRCAPDLIGFQEFQNGNLRVYESGLCDYDYALGPRYENYWPHAYNAIYWKRDEFELLDAGGFWLSETPEDFSRSWGSSHVRCANWVRLRHLSSNAEFVHLNTHLDHESGPARMAGAALILNRLDAEDSSIVMTGDFNCGPASKTYGIFARVGFTDAHLAAGNPPADTFHKFQGEFYRSKMAGRETRLDWVLLRDGSHSGWRVRSCEVIRDAEPPVYPSDHYPILAEISLEP